MADTITLQVNGKQQRVQVPPDTPLLYVLRNELNLTGPKYGCGLAQCGVCSVLMDNREIRSCVTPVADAVGHAITTIEGLPGLWAARRGSASGSADELHPLQRAWIDEQVPQCGYCQSGMMV